MDCPGSAVRRSRAGLSVQPSTGSTQKGPDRAAEQGGGETMNVRRWTVVSIFVFSGIGAAWAQDGVPAPDPASCPPGTVPEEPQYTPPPAPAPAHQTRLFSPSQIEVSV